MTSKGRETRATQRFQAQLSVTAAIEGRTFECGTGNVSLGGAYLLTGERFALGTKLALKLTLPSQKDPIETGSTVRWSDDSGIGVQFDGLRARDVWALGKFLS